MFLQEIRGSVLGALTRELEILDHSDVASPAPHPMTWGQQQ